MPWYMLALLSIVFLTFYVEISESCSCYPSHPQEKFCNSDFVILARIKQQKSLNGTIAYKARIRKEFKMSEKAKVALKSGRLLTPEGSSVCESELTLGKLYVLSGRIIHLQARINLCGMAYRWENLSKRQRKGLRMMYRQGCTCKISRCYGHQCMKNKNSCVWPVAQYHSMSCFEKEGICLPSPTKVCRWARSAPLAKCQAKENDKDNLINHLPFRGGPGRTFVQ